MTKAPFTGQKYSIVTLPPFLMFMVAFLSLCALSAVWVVDEFADLERENAAIRNAYIIEQKKILTTIVDEVVSFTEFNRGQTEQRVRRTIRERVEEASAIAKHHLRNFGATHSRTELQALIRESLRPIRFNQGRGYFFAFDLNGVEQLFADRPELEGKNMLGVLGARGEHVVRDSIDLARKDGEGYYSYYWTKPDEPRDQHFEKISYVKLIEPLGWIIGTGEYVAAMEKDIKREVLNRLSEMAVLDTEYVFAGHWDGTSLA